MIYIEKNFVQKTEEIDFIMSSILIFSGVFCRYSFHCINLIKYFMLQALPYKNRSILIKIILLIHSRIALILFDITIEINKLPE